MKTLNFEPDIFAIIRQNIKRYRKQRKMTSEQLAELVDLSHDFIRQIESGKYNFSVDTLYKISVALNVRIDKLFEKQNDDDTDNNENKNTPTK